MDKSEMSKYYRNSSLEKMFCSYMARTGWEIRDSAGGIIFSVRPDREYDSEGGKDYLLNEECFSLQIAVGKKDFAENLISLIWNDADIQAIIDGWCSTVMEKWQKDLEDHKKVPDAYTIAGLIRKNAKRYELKLVSLRGGLLAILDLADRSAS